MYLDTKAICKMMTIQLNLVSINENVSNLHIFGDLQ